MNALSVINNLKKTYLIEYPLRYCLVNKDKLPFKIDNTRASSNDKKSFVDFETISKVKNLERYRSLGISVQFSSICGIDIDHCFTSSNDLNTADDRAKYVIDTFKDFAYIEFSFSGCGLRALFNGKSLLHYKDKYLIKNSSNHIEYYQPYYEDEISYRYLTITGNTIVNNRLNEATQPQMGLLIEFLDKYMQRKRTPVISDLNPQINDFKSDEEMMKAVRKFLLKDFDFQDNWFNQAPGSGSNESERDFYLIKFIYQNITQDETKIISIFEQSPFYQSKDFYHKEKWNKNNHKYLSYIMNGILNK